MIDTDAGTSAARSASPHASRRTHRGQRRPLPFCSAVLWLSLCLPGAALAADIQDLRFRHDGIDRRYLLYVPDQLAASPGLVLSLHGGGGGGANAAAFENPSRHWQTLADREGIVVVYPEGVPVANVGPMWNDCRSALTGTQSTADDVGFVRALIDHLVETRGIDRSRVYLQGSSNGGMMSYRLAAELPGRFAGVAPVIANEPEDPAAECRRPSAPLGRTTLVVMNGTIDVLMPFNGGVVAQNPAQGLVISTADTIERWRQVNACQATPVMDFLPDVDPNDGSRVRREEWSGCAAGSRLLLYRVIGGGHSMPSLATPAPTFPQNRDIEAVETIWSVFAAAPRAEIVLEAGFEPGPLQTMADGDAGKTLLAAPSPATPACTFADARQRFAQLITDEGLPGGALLVGDRLGLRTEQYLGGYGPATVIPIASASKLLAAVRVLQLAGRGAVDLDAPLSTYLPQFTGPKGSMTLRQMFSHTAGYGDDSFAPVLVNPNLTLAEAVNQIAAADRSMPATRLAGSSPTAACRCTSADGSRKCAAVVTGSRAGRPRSARRSAPRRSTGRGSARPVITASPPAPAATFATMVACWRCWPTAGVATESSCWSPAASPSLKSIASAICRSRMRHRT